MKMKINDIVVKVSFINPIKKYNRKKCCFSIVTIVDINDTFITTIHKTAMFELKETWNIHDKTNIKNPLNFICDLDTAIDISLNRLTAGVDGNLTFVYNNMSYQFPQLNFLKLDSVLNLHLK